MKEPDKIQCGRIACQAMLDPEREKCSRCRGIHCAEHRQWIEGVLYCDVCYPSVANECIYCNNDRGKEKHTCRSCQKKGIPDSCMIYEHETGTIVAHKAEWDELIVMTAALFRENMDIKESWAHRRLCLPDCDGNDVRWRSRNP